MTNEEKIEHIKRVTVDSIILFQAEMIDGTEAMQMVNELKPVFISLPKAEQVNLLVWQQELIRKYDL